MADEMSLGERRKYLSVKRCTICFELTSDRASVTVCEDTGFYTQFGCILESVLKFGSNKFRTRFSCLKCSAVIVAVFNTLLEVNISALLTKNRTTDNTLQQVLEEGCSRCASVSTTVEEFTAHYLNHLFESYAGKKAVLENSMDVFSAIEDMKIEVAPVVAKNKKRKKAKKNTENSQKSRNDEVEVIRRLAEMASKAPLKKEEKYQDLKEEKYQDLKEDKDPESIKEIKSEHCYGRHDDSSEIVEADSLGEEVPDVREEPFEAEDDVAEDNSNKEEIEDCEKEEMRKRRNILIKKLVVKEVQATTNESRVCDLCGTVLNTKISVRNHMLRHKKNPNFPVTKRLIKEKGKINRQRKIENLESNPILCPKCGLVFKGNFEIVTHMQMMHNADRKECMKMLKRYRLWRCSACDQKFVNKLYFQKHIDKDHDGHLGDLRVQCEPCGRWYKNSKQLFQHIMLKHADMFPYMCSFCSKPFMLETNLIKHVIRHNENHTGTPEEKFQVMIENPDEAIQQNGTEQQLIDPMHVEEGKDESFGAYLLYEYLPGDMVYLHD